MVAGKEIFKTIRVSPDHCGEGVNLRSDIIRYSSTYNTGLGGVSAKHKDQLDVKDVKWSNGDYDSIIATAVVNGKIIVYDLNPGRSLELVRLQGHNRQVHKLAFCPHKGNWLLSGSQDATIRMWDLRVASTERSVLSFPAVARFNGYNDAVRDVRWSPGNGVEFAAATDSGVIQRWDIRKDSAPLMKINAHDKTCFCVDWHVDGKHLLSAGFDKLVKVWDFSSSDRRQKPCIQLRAPQAPMNVRWRPPACTKDSFGSDRWQSSQIATAYDQEDPRVHLWDLRRPHMPFREFDRYPNPPSDLLWRSTDLLWTVGIQGTFTQTDIRFAPQVIDRRSPSAVAWSPSGEILAFTQKRPKRRVFGTNNGLTDFLASGNRSDEKAGKNGDDVDETAFTPARKRQGKMSWPFGSTSASQSASQIVSFDRTVANDARFKPGQIGAVIRVPNTTFNPFLFRYLAKNYARLLDSPNCKMTGMDPMQRLLLELDANARYAEKASHYCLSQTWRIIKYAVHRQLLFPSENRPDVRSQADSESVASGCLGVDLGEKANIPHTNKDSVHEKARSHMFKGVMETEDLPGAVADRESSSTLTTPLVRPLPASPLGQSFSDEGSQNLDSDDLARIPPLPPSVLSSSITQLGFNKDYNTVDESRPSTPPKYQSVQTSQAGSVSPKSSALLAVEADLPQVSVDKTHRSAPLAISGRVGWRSRHVDDFEGRDFSYDKNKGQRESEYGVSPKKPLPSDIPQNNTKMAVFSRHDSGDSFPMFSTSTDSSQRSKSVGGFFSVGHNAEEAEESEGEKGKSLSTGTQSWSNTPSSPQDIEIGSPPRDPHEKGNYSSPPSVSFDESFSEANNAGVLRPSSPLPFLAERFPPKPPPLLPSRIIFDKTRRTDLKPLGVSVHPGNRKPDTLSHSTVVDSEPWGPQNLLRQAIRFYASSSPVDIQSAAHLLHKLHILVSPSEKLISYRERELVFKTYNEILLRQRMFTAAAELRLVCNPVYPAVYDYAQKDTFINVYCSKCKKPYENPERNNKMCYRCSVPQSPCTICMSLEPPSEWASQYTASAFKTTDTELSDLSLSSIPDTTTATVPESLDAPGDMLISRPHGSSLWAWCHGCGHGAHTACQLVWLNNTVLSQGGCATPGCGHDCGPGPRREQNKAASRPLAISGRHMWVLQQQHQQWQQRQPRRRPATTAAAVGVSPRGYYQRPPVSSRKPSGGVMRRGDGGDGVATFVKPDVAASTASGGDGRANGGERTGGTFGAGTAANGGANTGVAGTLSVGPFISGAMPEPVMMGTVTSKKVRWPSGRERAEQSNTPASSTTMSFASSGGDLKESDS